MKGFPAANLAVISVAGRYAADEAWEALHKGLHVLLFSDNVSLQDWRWRSRPQPQPDLRMSETSTADARAAGKPYVLVMDSARFKVSPACGRALTMVRYLLDRWTGEAKPCTGRR